MEEQSLSLLAGACCLFPLPAWGCAPRSSRWWDRHLCQIVGIDRETGGEFLCSEIKSRLVSVRCWMLLLSGFVESSSGC